MFCSRPCYSRMSCQFFLQTRDKYHQKFCSRSGSFRMDCLFWVRVLLKTLLFFGVVRATLVFSDRLYLGPCGSKLKSVVNRMPDHDLALKIGFLFFLQIDHCSHKLSSQRWSSHIGSPFQ